MQTVKYLKAKDNLVSNDFEVEANLFSILTRFGDVTKLRINYDPRKFLESINQFEDNWVQYNRSKPFIRREGLSLLSLDGGFSGIPDLDSLREYNNLNGTMLIENDIKTPTPAYEYALPYFDFIKEHAVRTHVIRLHPGGFFPIHRDNNSINVKSFRLFVPLANCNPPEMFFMIDDDYRVLNFDHGSVYFINTSLPHAVFNASSSKTSYFIVVNVELNVRSVEKTIDKFSVK